MKYFLLSVAIVLTASFSAAAQDNPSEPSRVRYKLPVVPTDDAGMKCLDNTQWQQVIKVASEYKGLFEWRLAIEPTLMKYQTLEKDYELQISIMQMQIDELKDSREYLQLRLKQERGANLRFNKSYKIEKALMWGIIAIETVVIGISGIRGIAN